MSNSFYWYDYETWGIDPRYSRPAQFAGVRTDLDFNQIGDPLVIYAKPNDDMLPDPDAVMITGITPQKAKEEGLTEADFAKAIHSELSTPNTISLGYNTIRFDEAFNRYLFWRNFYDPFEHGWKNGCSTWDIIDVVRLTRALRPEGINWPEQDGKPTNRLEKLTVANGIKHADAHDALSDVRATIELAKLIKTKQPKLFEYAFNNRDKQSVQKLLDPAQPKPVIHSSDKYGSEVLSTALVVPVAQIESGRKILVFDLKTPPESILDLSVEEIVKNLFTSKAELTDGDQRLGVKGVKINASPVLAPAGTLDDAAAERIRVDKQQASKNFAKFKKHQQEMASKLMQAFNQDQPQYSGDTQARSFIDAESKLYDGFVSDDERGLAQRVLAGDFKVNFKDERLQELLWRYKARNFSAELTDEERAKWEEYRRERLAKSPMNVETFSKRLQQLSQDKALTDDKRYLLEQLQLYAESIYPYDV